LFENTNQKTLLLKLIIKRK